MRTRIEGFAILIAALLSVVSLCVSILVFYRDTESQQLKRDQNQAMRVVAANAVILWKHIQNLSVLYSLKVEVEPLIFEDMQKKASRLEDSIVLAIGLGLYEDLLSSRSCSVNNYIYFSKFLANLQTLDPHDSPTIAWGRDEFTFSLIRLMDMVKRYNPPLLPNTVWEQVHIDDDLIAKSWSEGPCS